MSVVTSSYRFHCIKTELNYDYPNDYKILKGYHLFLLPAWVSPGYFQRIKYSSGPPCHFCIKMFWCFWGSRSELGPVLPFSMCKCRDRFTARNGLYWDSAERYTVRCVQRRQSSRWNLRKEDRDTFSSNVNSSTQLRESLAQTALFPFIFLRRGWPYFYALSLRVLKFN